MEGGQISALDWAKGIFLSILASIIGGISKLLIRKSWLWQVDIVGHEQGSALVDGSPLYLTTTNGTENFSLRDGEAPIPGDEANRLKLFSSSLRYSGMFGMSVLNPICCVLAMNYASPSILAPFSGLTLVWVILGSPIVNDEKPSTQQILACCLIVSGEVVVAIFGDHTTDENITIPDIEKSYEELGFISYFVGLAAYIVLMIYFINYSDNCNLRRFAWGCSGGAITGAQNFLKDSLTIFKAIDPQQKPPLLLYPLILLAAITAFVGLLLLTACMKRYDATYSAAAFVGSFVVSASVMAAVHYNTFAQLDGIVNVVLYPSGVIMLMFGVYLLVRESNGSSEEIESANQERHTDNSNEDIGFDSERSTMLTSKMNRLMEYQL